MFSVVSRSHCCLRNNTQAVRRQFRRPI